MKNPINAIAPLSNNQFKMSVLSSLLWSVDMMTIGRARNMFYKLHKQLSEDGSVSGWNNYLAQLDDIKASDKFRKDSGFTSELDDVTALISFANDIYEEMEKTAILLAPIGSPTSRMPVRKTYAELLNDEKPQAVGSAELERFNLIAEELSEDDKDRELNVKMLKINVEEQNKRLFERNKPLAPYVEGFLQDLYTLSPCTVFSDMSPELQARLVESTRRAVDSTKVRAASWKSINTIEFMTILADVKAVKAEIAA